MTPLRTDEQLEQHIADCGRRMEAAYAIWERDGCFSARGEAGHWRIQMERAINSRSAGQVARMEQERGLASA